MAGRLRQFLEPVRESPIWLTVYSDMMTNLMLFFLMLFALTQRGQQAVVDAAVVFSAEFASGARIEAAPLEELEALEEGLKYVKSADIQIKFDTDAMRIVFSAPLLFDLGKAELKSSAVEVLHQLAIALRGLPNKFVVEGHTDNLPIRRGKYKSNWDLSSARAENIVKYFVHKEEFSPKQFAVAAYGEYRPVAPNDTNFNRRKNRRVELVVLRK